MRRDLWTKLAMLETRTSEIQSLNEELRRQIEQRSRRLMSTLFKNSVKARRRIWSGWALRPSFVQGPKVGLRR